MKIKQIALLVLIIVATGFAFYYLMQRGGWQHRAEIEILKGNFDEALKQYAEVAEEEKENPRYHYLVGRTHILRGEKNKARACFEESLALQPIQADSHYEIALLDYQNNAFSDALNHLIRASGATDHDHQTPEIHYLTGLVHEKTGELNMALHEYGRAIVADKNFSYAYGRAARIYQLNRDHAKGEEMARKALQLNDQLSMPHLVLAGIYVDRKKWDDAITEAQLAIGFDHTVADNHVVLGNAYSGKKLFKAAIEQWKMALKLDPKSLPAWISLGYLYEAKKKNDLAVKAYTEALQCVGNQEQLKQKLEKRLEKLKLRMKLQKK